MEAQRFQPFPGRAQYELSSYRPGVPYCPIGMSALPSARALVIGGTGPTGPAIVHGLEHRGLTVTLFHTGRHEVEEVAHVEHLHGNPFSAEAVDETLSGRSFDVVVACYGRLRAIAEVLSGRCDRFVSVGGTPAYRGYFDPTRFDPPGLPIPTAEDAPRSTEDDGGKSYRVARTEDLLFGHQPSATHLRYPFVYGPRQIAPLDWCIVRRVLDRRPAIIVPDAGLAAETRSFSENAAHTVLLAVDQPAAGSRVFNVGDEEALTVAQRVGLICAELGHEMEIVGMPTDLALPARPLMMQAEPGHRILDLSATRDVLGYRDLVPARRATGLAARWLADNPLEPGGSAEQVLEDPFDYEREDRLLDWWRSATCDPPDLDYPVEPGFGIYYSGPGTSRRRNDERI